MALASAPSNSKRLVAQIIATVALVALSACQTTGGTFAFGNRTMYVKNEMTGAILVDHIDTCREKTKNVKAPPLSNLSYGPAAKVGLLGALLVAAIAIGEKGVKDEEAKEVAYDKCMEKNGFFEASVPTGVYNAATGSGDLSARTATIDEFVQSARFAEIEEWGRVRSEDTIQGYEVFTANFPDSPEVSSAKERIDVLIIARAAAEKDRRASLWMASQKQLYGLDLTGWNEDPERGSDGCPGFSVHNARGDLKFLVDDGLVYGFVDINFRDSNPTIVGTFDQDGSVELYSNWPEENPLSFIGRFDPEGHIKLFYASNGGDGCERRMYFIRVPETTVSAEDSEAVEEWLEAPPPAREELVELYERLAGRPLLVNTNTTE